MLGKAGRKSSDADTGPPNLVFDEFVASEERLCTNDTSQRGVVPIEFDVHFSATLLWLFRLLYVMEINLLLLLRVISGTTPS